MEMERELIFSPAEIEHRSFEIIREELDERGIQVPPEELPVTARVIHTTADFEYTETLYFSPGWREAADRALVPGNVLVTDTNMALSGIAKRALKELDLTAVCLMADPEVAEEAAARGVTRASVSVEKAAERYGERAVFVCGNAPTALMTLSRLIREGYRPAFAVGVPVGFVNVVHSKEELIQTGIPCVVNRGRKGGSTVAAAVVNALLYQRAASRGSAPLTP